MRLSNGDAQTQAELFKIPHLQFVRIAVDSTQKRQTFALQKSGDRNVGGQHEFFNDLVAFIMMPLVSSDDGPVLIEINFDFRDSHGQRAVGIAEPSKHHRQLKHIVEQLTDRCRDALDLLRRVLNNGHDFFIRESTHNFDRRVRNVVADHAAGGIEFNESGFRVTQLSLLETGQSIADQFGQHGDDVSRQINAGAPFASFNIQRTAGRHEVRDVGNVDSQVPVAIVRSVQRDCIIEVASCRGVDRDNRFGSEVYASGQIVFIKRFGLTTSIVENGFRKLIRYAQNMHDCHRVDTRIAALSKDFREYRFTMPTGRGEPQHFNNHFIVGRGSFGTRVAYVDRCLKCRPVDLHKSLATGFQIGPDEDAGGAFDDLFNDAAPLSAGSTFCGESHQDIVAGLTVSHIPRGDVNVGFTFVGIFFGGDYESSAAADFSQNAGDQSRIAACTQPTLFILPNTAAFNKIGECILEVMELRFRDLHRFCKNRCGHRCVVDRIDDRQDLRFQRRRPA